MSSSLLPGGTLVEGRGASGFIIFGLDPNFRCRVEALSLFLRLYAIERRALSGARKLENWKTRSGKISQLWPPPIKLPNLATI